MNKIEVRKVKILAITLNGELKILFLCCDIMYDSLNILNISDFS